MDEAQMTGGQQRMSNDLRIMIVQSGARRNYELAYMFEEAGALHSLHTTSAWTGAKRRPLDILLSLTGAKARKAIARRRLDARIPAGKIHAHYLADLARQFGERVYPELQRAKNLQNHILGNSVLETGFDGANVYFTVDGNGGFAAIDEARSKGLKIVADVVITPLSDQIMREEAARWPGWPTRDLSERQIELVEGHYLKLIEKCDLLICPSKTVADGLTALDCSAAQKIALIPYGLGGYEIGRNSPTKGRVLFAGGAPLRKGLPYLGLAASALKKRGAPCEVVVAGHHSEDVCGQPECADLTFLGQLGRDDMKAEFRRADVLCLPSLAEGSAGVCLEALAYGVPCIVTEAAGAPVTDGREGIIVPERDPEAIAIAIETLVSDRSRRAECAAAGLATARNHTDAAITKTLLATLRNMVGLSQVELN